MIKHLTLSLLLIVSASAFAQTSAQLHHESTPISYRPLKETIGEKFLALPLPGSLDDDGYPLIRRNDQPMTRLHNADLAGKTLTLESFDGTIAHLKDSANVEYTARPSGYFFSFISVSDLENARKLFLNKKLWIKNDIACAVCNTTGDCRKINKFEPVTVIDVSPGQFYVYPIRFTIKTVNGELGSYDVDISGTNTRKYLEAPLHAHDSEHWFENAFLIQQPN